MQQTDFSRQYVILRPLRGCAGGFARLETRQGQSCMALQIHHAPLPRLRVMMMSGTGPAGALVDLGVLTANARGQASMFVSRLPQDCSACHTLLLCSDWPDAQLQLYGCITPSPVCTLWQLQDALRGYLSVPAPDTALPDPLPLPQSNPEPPLYPAPQRPPLSRLPVLQWPRELAELKCYFDELPPFSPFRMPGWRFVRAPLHHGPAPWCAIGIHIRGSRVTQALYALPGEEDHPPLQGYAWEGGYWIRRSSEP